MIASLPMYGFDGQAVDALWVSLRDALRRRGMADVPPGLIAIAGSLFEHWRQPDLLVSQTCGYPLVRMLTSDVSVIGAFVYDAPGCESVTYRSRLVARVDDRAEGLADFRGRRAAFNGRDSQSGYNSFRAAVAPLASNGRFFGETLETGSHLASMRAVAGGDADIAAIDCVTLAGFFRVDPDLAGALKVVGETAAAPGLPLITRGSASLQEVETLRSSLAEVVADPASRGWMSRLMIGGFQPMDFADYAGIAAIEQAAILAGYPDLA